MNAPVPGGVASTAHVFIHALDDELEIDGGDAHHLARALRVRRGEVVTAADGRGAWRPYAAGDVGPRLVRLHALGATATVPEPRPRVELALALLPADRLALAVRGATELGVDTITLVEAARCVGAARGTPADAFRARTARVAREAAMQSRRVRLVDVTGPLPVVALAGRPGLVVAEPGGEPLGDLVPAGAGCTVLVGPEGGLAGDELARLDEAGPAPRVRLGPAVCRSETAAIAAVALLGAIRDRIPECTSDRDS